MKSPHNTLLAVCLCILGDWPADASSSPSGEASGALVLRADLPNVDNLLRSGGADPKCLAVLISGGTLSKAKGAGLIHALTKDPELQQIVGTTIALANPDAADRLIELFHDEGETPTTGLERVVDISKRVRRMRPRIHPFEDGTPANARYIRGFRPRGNVSDPSTCFPDAVAYRLLAVASAASDWTEATFRSARTDRLFHHRRPLHDPASSARLPILWASFQRAGEGNATALAYGAWLLGEQIHPSRIEANLDAPPLPDGLVPFPDNQSSARLSFAALACCADAEGAPPWLDPVLQLLTGPYDATLAANPVLRDARASQPGHFMTWAMRASLTAPAEFDPLLAQMLATMGNRSSTGSPRALAALRTHAARLLAGNPVSARNSYCDLLYRDALARLSSRPLAPLLRARLPRLFSGNPQTQVPPAEAVLAAEMATRIAASRVDVQDAVDLATLAAAGFSARQYDELKSTYFTTISAKVRDAASRIDNPRMACHVRAVSGLVLLRFLQISNYDRAPVTAELAAAWSGLDHPLAIGAARLFPAMGLQACSDPSPASSPMPAPLRLALILAAAESSSANTPRVSP